MTTLRNNKKVFVDIDAIHQARRSSLRALVNSTAGGSVAEFSRRYQFDPTRIRQLLDGSTRNIGEKAARQIEDRCGLPDFFLDSGDGVAVTALISAFNKLDGTRRAEIIRHIASLLPEQQAELLALIGPIGE